MSVHDLKPLPPKPSNPIPVWVMAILAVLWLIVWDLEISFETLAYGVEDMREYFSRYGQPDFSNLSRYLGKVCKTFLPDCRDGTIAT
jgi:phosphonate transport system permease protein